MKHSIKLTKTILLVTIFLPGLACAAHMGSGSDPTGWYKLTPENIQAVPPEKPKQEHEQVTILVENVQRALSNSQLANSQISPQASAQYQKLLDFRKKQHDIIQTELARRAATAAST